MEKQKILFVVSNNPFSKDRKTILKLAEELLELNMEVVIYLHGNGVWWLGLEDLKNLSQKGAQIYGARYSTAKRSQTIPPWAKELDLEGFVDLVEKADKVLFFN